jgi:hypothetical protein
MIRDSTKAGDSETETVIRSHNSAEAEVTDKNCPHTFTKGLEKEKIFGTGENAIS